MKNGNLIKGLQTSVIIGSLLLFLSTSVKAQQVSPFQTGAYSTAFTNVRDMAKGAPGLFVVWYNQYAFSKNYADRDGNKYDKIPLTDGVLELDLDVDVATFATAPAIFYGMPFTILGGAQWMVGIAPSYIWADASVTIDASGNIAGNEGSESENYKLNGIGDMYFAPLALSWGWSHFDLTFYYGFTAPTGRYETGADDNIGLGFWTHQPQLFGYYYPVEDQSSAFMVGLTYELNGEVRGEDFNPGNRFSLEYGMSQYISETVELGVMGGHNWQVTDDRGSEVIWDPTQHDRKSTLAFTAGYWAWKERLQLTAKYAFDYASRQRFNTNFFMLNITFVTNALTGSKAN